MEGKGLKTSSKLLGFQKESYSNFFTQDRHSFDKTFIIFSAGIGTDESGKLFIGIYRHFLTILSFKQYFQIS